METRVRLRRLLRTALLAALASASAAPAVNLPSTEVTTEDGSLTSRASLSGFLERSLRPRAYHLWEGTGFGRQPRERAAWVLSGETDRVRWQIWPEEIRHLQAGWLGPIPADAIAIVHTHPLGVDPRPSPQDVKTARRIGMPVYTVSRVGIWKAGPDGLIVAVDDERWWSACRSGACGTPD